MAKQLVVDKFKVITAKEFLDGIKKLVELADIHDGINMVNKYGRKSLKLLEKYFEDADDIDAIVVSGDHVLSAKSYLDPKCMAHLEYLMQMFGEKAPTIVSKGNHDLYFGNAEIDKKFKSLEKINNVYPLDNEQVTIDGVTYTGFSPSLPAYSIMNYGKKANETFIKDWRAAEFKFSDQDLNILLEHDPITISSDEVLEEINEDLKNITMIASGHLHNGYITTAHERRSKEKLSDKGIWESPLTRFKIDTCRGAYKLGNGEKSPVYLPEQDDYCTIEMTDPNEALLVVTKGVSKYPLSRWGGDPNITEVVLQSPSYVEDLDTEIKQK